MLIFFDRWYKGKDRVYRSSINTGFVMHMSPIDIDEPEEGTRIVMDPARNDGHKQIIYTKLTVGEMEAIVREASNA